MFMTFKETAGIAKQQQSLAREASDAQLEAN